jgi:broad specificity phosphatase PhoE
MKEARMAASIRLFLIRHGETAWSLSGQHTGLRDLPLTEHGEEQARALRSWLEPITFAWVFVSPRLRARRTCELTELSVAAKNDDDLQEWNYGEYEGLTSRAICDARPDWDIFSNGCPGGESPDEVCDRADRVIKRLRTFGGTVALFSHGEFGRVLAARWIGAPITMARNLALGAASVSSMTYEADHPETPVIEFWNASPMMPALSQGRPHTARLNPAK